MDDLISPAPQTASAVIWRLTAQVLAARLFGLGVADEAANGAVEGADQQSSGHACDEVEDHLGDPFHALSGQEQRS